jgi:methionine synthase I (cobalamin-dependent)
MIFSTSVFSQANKVVIVNNNEGIKFVVDGKDFIVNGQGGTEKLTKYSVLISDFYKKDLKTAYVNEIKNLKKGDEVIIHIEYVYNTTKSSVRTIENLIGITKIKLPLKVQMEK